MMFTHGFGCDQNMCRYIVPTFERDYRIVLFDYVGSGRSDLRAYDPARYSRLDGYANDVPDLCAALDLTNVILVGHSVSSIVGVLAAKREPERFAHLILIGSSPRYINVRLHTPASSSAPTSKGCRPDGPELHRLGEFTSLP